MRHFIVAAALSVGTPLYAQSSSPPPGSSDAATAASRESPDNDPRGGFLNSGVQLLARAGDASAQLTLSTDVDNRNTFGNTQFGVTLSAPIDKDRKEARLITERGITNGFGAEFSVSTMIGSAKPPAVPARGFVRQHLFLGSLVGGFSVEDFGYRDPSTFAKSEDRKTTYHGAATIGYLPPGGATFLSTGYEYRRGWKAPDQRILCAPVAAGTIGECIESVFAPPDRDVDHIAFASFRTLNLFGLTGASPLVLEIKAAYDIEDDVVGVEAPIYLFLDADKKLRGGLRFGWDSEEDDVRIGLFVGVPFDLLGS